MKTLFHPRFLLIFCFAFLSLTGNTQFKSLLKKVKEKAGQLKDNVVHQVDSTVQTEAASAVDRTMDKYLGKEEAKPSTEPAQTQQAKPDSVSAAEKAVAIKTTGTEAEGSDATLPSARKSGEAKRLNSELDNAALHQQSSVPRVKEGYTRLYIAKNLALDVKGKYPAGYEPKWRFISYESKLNMKTENWISPRSTVSYNKKDISFGDYKGKAVMRYGAFVLCDCMADIVIDGELAVLTEAPQTFKVTNFQKILNERRTGEPCVSMNVAHFGGGTEGQVTLSSNGNGDIVMNLTLETYTAEKRNDRWYNPETKQREAKVFPPKVSYRFTAEGITVDNEMSPEKAAAIVKAEEEAKQRRKDFLVRSKKQVDSLLKLIPAKYAGTECRSCFSNERDYAINPVTHEYYYVNSGAYAGSSTDLNMSTTLVVKNKCNYPITFIGIQQRYDDERGYYYTDVTKTMEANYEYKSEQDAFVHAFFSILGANKDMYLQREYSIEGATLNSIQWLKVIRLKN